MGVSTSEMDHWTVASQNRCADFRMQHTVRSNMTMIEELNLKASRNDDHPFDLFT